MPPAAVNIEHWDALAQLLTAWPDQTSNPEALQEEVFLQPRQLIDEYTLASTLVSCGATKGNPGTQAASAGDQ